MSKDHTNVSDYVENLETLRLLSKNNPGACSVIFELIKKVEHEKLFIFFDKIIMNNILGTRLWYIYKNECNMNIDELIEKDLTPFTDLYFYDKFEKYI